ncbi:MAG TPA: hypothetical protein VGW38_24545 [Chloroflexota bacterium]|nr:hypothetical protein [Chloroflexota bacterium]
MPTPAYPSGLGSALAWWKRRVTSVLPNDGTSPIDACAREWESGSMVQGVAQAPPLAACVSSTGVVTVTEATGEQSCAATDMAPWDE